MHTELIIDNRENASQVIRRDIGRRTNKVLFHLLKRPFKDSNGHMVTTNRRSKSERRCSYN